MSIEYYGFSLFIAALICLIAILCKVLFSDTKRQQKLLNEKETKLLQLYQTVESIVEEWGDQAKATTEELKEYEGRIVAQAAALAMQVQAAAQAEQAALLAAQPAAVRTERNERLPRVDPTRIKAANDALERAEKIVKNAPPPSGTAPAGAAAAGIPPAAVLPAAGTNAAGTPAGGASPNKTPAGGTSARGRSSGSGKNAAQASSPGRAPSGRAPSGGTPAGGAKSDNGAVFQRLFDETTIEQAAAAEAPAQQIKNEAIIALAGEGRTYAQIASDLGITQNEVKLVIGLARK